MKKASYDHTKIEKKWQKKWAGQKLYQAKDDSKDKKFYSLIEFPYPSGDGLHVGHPRPYIGMDVISRKRRMEGFNVLYPIGWDAFGLPTENYAIKTGKQPQVVTKKNTGIFKRQIQSLGISFDWSREINTTDPNYYKWTQWIFLQFFKKGLAYKKKMAINWCPKDMIGLANEEVVNGHCERCGTPVEKREREQWMLAITKYADRLDKDLDTVDYLPQIKTQQRNWIGKSEGALIKFRIKEQKANTGGDIEVFTTRPDTLFGVTYMVLAPEHKLVKGLADSIENKKEVEEYIAKTRKETEIERTDAAKEKTGVELKGIKAINPANNEEISVWIADYVLADYGTGAVMAVPAHDERDWDFAKKFNLPINFVIAHYVVEKEDPPRKDVPMVFRKAVNVYVKNPKDGSFLMLEWKTTHWRGPISGGIEKGEDPIISAKREVREETGYKNIKFIKYLGSPIRVDFYHPAKKENRAAEFTGLLFELENEDKDEVGEEEKKQHEAKWIPNDKIASFINTGQIFFSRITKDDLCYLEEGRLVNSGSFDNNDSVSAKKAITESVGGKIMTTYKLRDWVFSRQRYWGEPIPVIHCPACGIVPVPEKDLPVKLPKVKDYKPPETGESPLAAVSKWVNVKCPTCKGSAKRETDTMPNWAGSSWYYLRYTDPKNKKAFADPKRLKYWTPVDWYNGGMEHTTLHLLYSRFWHKFLFDLKLVPTSEPYKKRTSHGLILAKGGEKMSKSKGNVINPDDIVKNVGADALRVYEMFMGPFDQAISWDTDNIAGSRRFIERVWKLGGRVSFPALSKNDRKVVIFPQGQKRDAPGTGPVSDPIIDRILHKTVKKVSDDIEAMRFNTAISALMICVNELEKAPEISRADYESLLKLVAPFAPHAAEEIWSLLGNKTSIHLSSWPVYDPKLAADSEATIMIQIDGKVRGSFTAAAGTDKAGLERLAKALPEAQKWLEGKVVSRVIVVPDKLVNIVLSKDS